MLTTDNLQNLQFLLDDVQNMNFYTPSAGEVGTDNFYITGSLYQALKSYYQTAANLYIYNTNVFNSASEKTTNDWNDAYRRLFLLKNLD